MAKFPDNWHRYIVPRIKQRAGYACESCGVRNGHRGWWRGGEFLKCKPGIIPPQPSRVIRIQLEVVALDHRPNNCDLMNHIAPAPPRAQSNLRAYCQRCAVKHHKTKPKRKRRKKKPQQQELF